MADVRVAAALLSLLAVATACRQSPGERPVSIVLISIDSLRADHVGAYGYGRGTTPRLDRLAREGALFETAIAESSWTIPTHATMLTGVGSRVHGMETGYVRLSGSRPTLARLLTARGYRTAGVFSGPYLHPVFGFDQGFHSYESVIPPPTGAAPPRVVSVDRLMAAQEAALHVPTSAAVTDKAIAFVENVRGQQFFLFLHYFDVHYDYDPPEPYWRRFDPDYRGPFTGRNFIHNRAIHADMESRDLRHLIARYDGEILYADEQIGRLLDALDGNGLSRDTLVVVTSDHGDEFFEHGQRGHRRSLYEEVIRVPLIVRLPGRIPAGARIGGLARHVDVAPTVLSYAGVEARTEGTDLRPSLEAGHESPIAFAVSRLVRTPIENEWTSVRTRRTKYVHNRDGDRRTERVFDLESDPAENDPVLTLRGGLVDPRSDLDESRALLADWYRRGDPDTVGRLDTTGGISPEILERLRALGYVQ